MKVFEGLAKKQGIGQMARDFSLGGDSSLSNSKGSPILLVFWKTL